MSQLKNWKKRGKLLRYGLTKVAKKISQKGGKKPEIIILASL
jgi:hypothetical protein